MVVAGDYAYLADEDEGLHVVYVADPASPSLAGAYTCRGNGVTVAEDHIYLACGNLAVLRFIDGPVFSVYLPLTHK